MRYVLPVLFALAIAPNNADAHVRVFSDPNATVAPACGFSKFIVRVPVEKPIATTRVDLIVPSGVIVYAVQPKPGWKANLVMNHGIVKTIQWSDGKLFPHEFDEFSFLAATPKTRGIVSWDAWQYYEDGSIVKWTGNPKAETPHSQTSIVAPLAPCKGK